MSTSRSPIAWTEIPADDFSRAVAFYQNILDVEITTQDLGELKMGTFGGDYTGLAICRHPQFYFPGEQGPVVFLRAGDKMEEILSRVEVAGGAIVIPRREIGGGAGFMALFKDSEGNRIGVRP